VKITKYNSGQIKEEITYITKNDSSNYLLVEYFKNGKAKIKGSISNNQKSGLWQEWYMDGTKKWEGEFENNIRKLPITIQKPSIILEDSTLQKNRTTHLRLVLDSIHPEDMAIGCNNGIINISDKKDMYDYMVTPNDTGIIRFYFFLKREGRMTQVGKDSLNVSL
jgi:antitoxin component YwqK of YwqJK toxin-antitoxin module